MISNSRQIKFEIIFKFKPKLSLKSSPANLNFIFTYETENSFSVLFKKKKQTLKFFPEFR